MIESEASEGELEPSGESLGEEGEFDCRSDDNHAESDDQQGYSGRQQSMGFERGNNLGTEDNNGQSTTREDATAGRNTSLEGGFVRRGRLVYPSSSSDVESPVQTRTQNPLRHIPQDMRTGLVRRSNPTTPTAVAARAEVRKKTTPPEGHRIAKKRLLVESPTRSHDRELIIDTSSLPAAIEGVDGLPGSSTQLGPSSLDAAQSTIVGVGGTKGRIPLEASQDGIGTEAGPSMQKDVILSTPMDTEFDTNNYCEKYGGTRVLCFQENNPYDIGRRIEDCDSYKDPMVEPGWPEQAQDERIGPSETLSAEMPEARTHALYVQGPDGYWYDSAHARYRRIEPTDGATEPSYEEVGLMELEDANIVEYCWALGADGSDLATNLGRQSSGPPLRPPSSRPRAHSRYFLM